MASTNQPGKQELTLDFAMEAFDANPNEETACIYRECLKQYSDDGIIADDTQAYELRQIDKRLAGEIESVFDEGPQL